VKGFMASRDMVKKMSGLSMGSRMKMAQAMSQFDVSKLAPGGMPKMGGGTQQQKSRLTPEQKRKLRDKRLRGK